VSDPPAEPPATTPGLPAVRASDGEREHAAEVLRRAATDGRLTVEELEDRLHGAYGAVTRAELEHLIADVDPDGTGAFLTSAGGLDATAAAGSTVASAGAAAGAIVREGPGGSRWVVAVMSGNDRRGRWRIAPKCTVLNVMGGSTIDLSSAEFAARETELRVYSVMGGGDVRVPLGFEVHVSEFALMGGNDVRLGDVVPSGTGPVLRIRLVSIMSGCSVRRGPRKKREDRRQDKELRRAERRDRELRRADRRGELDAPPPPPPEL
jgi:hypothetical protein